MSSNEKFLEENDISRNDNGKLIAEDYTLKDLLKRFPASEIDVSYVTNLDGIFKDYTRDSQLFFDVDDLSNWNISNVTSMKGLFNNAIIDKDLGINNWNTDKVEDISNAFENVNSNDKLDLSNWKLSSLKSYDNAFTNSDIKVEHQPSKEYFLGSEKENEEVKFSLVGIKKHELTANNHNELSVYNEVKDKTVIGNVTNYVNKVIDDHCGSLTDEDKENGLLNIAMLQAAFKHLKEFLKESNIPSNLKSTFNEIAQHLGSMNDPTLSLISGVIHGFTKDSQNKTYLKDRVGAELVNKEVNGEALDKLLKRDILTDRNITNLETLVKKVGINGLLNNTKMFKQYMQEKFTQDKPKPEDMSKYSEYLKKHVEDLRTVANSGKGAVATFEEYLKAEQSKSTVKDRGVSNSSKKSKEDYER